MKAVLTVTGRDNIGIIARVSGICAKYDANILEISQSVLQEYFAMIMLIDIDALNIPFTEFVDRMHEEGTKAGLEIQTMHEDIFNSMHRI